MNKEQLAARMGELHAAKEQSLQTFHALQSQINECGFWLAKIEEAEHKPSDSINQFVKGFDIEPDTN